MIDLALAITLALCKRFEGLYLRPYLCPAGVPTIGYGTTYYEDGTRVTLFDPPITKERAEELLLHMVKTVYLPAVIRLCPNIDDPLRLAAIIDWTYNLGATNLRASTMRKKILAEQWDEVPAELRKWNKGGGKILPGLVRRRESEAVLV